MWNINRFPRPTSDVGVPQGAVFGPLLFPVSVRDTDMKK